MQADLAHFGIKTIYNQQVLVLNKIHEADLPTAKVGSPVKIKQPYFG